MTSSTDFWTSSEKIIDEFMLSPYFKYLMIIVGSLSILSALFDYMSTTNLGTHSLSFLGLVILGAGIIFFLGKHDQFAKEQFTKYSSSSSSM
jgi:hypothetical protein